MRSRSVCFLDLFTCEITEVERIWKNTLQRLHLQTFEGLQSFAKSHVHSGRSINNC